MFAVRENQPPFVIEGPAMPVADAVRPRRRRFRSALAIEKREELSQACSPVVLEADEIQITYDLVRAPESKAVELQWDDEIF